MRWKAFYLGLLFVFLLSGKLKIHEIMSAAWYCAWLYRPNQLWHDTYNDKYYRNAYIVMRGTLLFLSLIHVYIFLKEGNALDWYWSAHY